MYFFFSYGQIRASMYKLLNLKPLAPLKPGLCLHLLFNILPGRCEFTPPNTEEKNSDGAHFFLEGATKKVKTALKHSKGVL